MGKFWNSTRSEWWINFLLHFPTPTSVTQYTEEEFCSLASPIIGRKVNKQAKLQELYATAQHSIGLPVAPDSLACQTFKLQLQRYQELTSQRERLEQQAESLLSDHKDYRILKSIPGIGPIIALTILAEGGDLRRFAHHRQFLKYCGLELAKNHSGNFRGQEKLSKRGNARFAWPCSWRPSTLCGKLRIAFEINFTAIPKRHPMTPIANAKPELQSWQRWRVLSTRSLNHQPLIRVTLKFCPVDRSLSVGPLGPIGPRR